MKIRELFPKDKEEEWIVNPSFFITRDEAQALQNGQVLSIERSGPGVNEDLVGQLVGLSGTRPQEQVVARVIRFDQDPSIIGKGLLTVEFVRVNVLSSEPHLEERATREDGSGEGDEIRARNLRVIRPRMPRSITLPDDQLARLMDLGEFQRSVTSTLGFLTEQKRREIVVAVAALLSARERFEKLKSIAERFFREVETLCANDQPIPDYYTEEIAVIIRECRENIVI